MKALTRPYWVLLTVTLPSLVTLLYYLAVYSVVASLLEGEHLARWQWGAGILATLALSSLLYTFRLYRRGATLGWRYGATILLLYGVLMFTYLNEGIHLLPGSVAAWMVSEDEFYLLPFGLMMPSLLHGLLLLVNSSIRPDERAALLKASLATAVVPAFWYMALRSLFPLLSGHMSWEVYRHLSDIFYVVAGVTFLFMVLRLFYLMVMRLPQSPTVTLWLLRLPFALLLPLLSLAIYNDQLPLMPRYSGESLHLFGDWSHAGYYLLALLNGVLLLLPQPRAPRLLLALFLAKGALFPLTLYFFIVFLPFLPFALPAIFFYGIGLLLLTPILLFIIQSVSLVGDWQRLALHYRLRRLVPALLIVLMLAPSLLTAFYWADRTTLNAMLTHLYEPDLAATAPVAIDRAAARRVLDHIRLFKQGGDFFSGRRKPYLTSYYQWLVLDSLTLSEQRRARLEQIFFGESTAVERREWRDAAPGCWTDISALDSSTALAPDGHYFISRIELTLRNKGGDGCEYATRFKLPMGAWVRNYYLMIDGQRVEGMLAERKSALWVYQQIRDTRRDPGLLYYSGAEELTLRIFPFLQGESRRSGFEIIHREPLTLAIDNRSVELRTTQPLWPSTTDSKRSQWIAGAEKRLLPHLQRTPYLHFIVDRSLRGERRLDEYRKRIEAFLAHWQQQGHGLANARVSVVNHSVQTLPLEPGWQERAAATPAEGGFFLQRALQQGLYDNYRQHPGRYPLFVVITDTLAEAVVDEGLTAGALLAPEGESFLLLGSVGEVTLHQMESPLVGTRISGIVPPPHAVVAWPNLNQPRAYLRDDGNASLVVDLDAAAAEGSLGGSEWDRGLALYSEWLATRIAPRRAGRRETQLVMQSFATHHLTPVTAFISTENEVQRQVLRRKQAEVLAASRPLDVGEEHRMDEPALWLLLPLLLFIVRRRLSDGGLVPVR